MDHLRRYLITQICKNSWKKMVSDLQVNETNSNRTHGQKQVHLPDEENIKESEAKTIERDDQIATGTEKVRKEITDQKSHPHIGVP